MSMPFIYDDGGRSETKFKGKAGDCGVRAIAIAFEMTYMTAYELMREANRWFAETHRCKVAKLIQRKGPTPRNGNYRKPFRMLMNELDATWVSTMSIGSGCKVHLRADELPQGRLIVNVSKHYTTMIDGVIHDTWDCSRAGTRCVYGYWIAG